MASRATEGAKCQFRVVQSLIKTQHANTAQTTNPATNTQKSTNIMQNSFDPPDGQQKATRTGAAKGAGVTVAIKAANTVAISAAKSVAISAAKSVAKSFVVKTQPFCAHSTLEMALWGHVCCTYCNRVCSPCLLALPGSILLFSCGLCHIPDLRLDLQGKQAKSRKCKQKQAQARKSKQKPPPGTPDKSAHKTIPKMP